MDDDQFGQLVEPPPVPFSFGAPGWYVLAFLALVVLLFVAWMIWKHYRINKYRKEALLLLQKMENTYAASNDYAGLVYASNMLTKRIAMAKYGRESAAGLRNSEWTNYLNSKWHKKSFDDNDRLLVTDDIYTSRSIDAAKASAFVNKTKQWIKDHKNNRMIFYTRYASGKH